MAVDVNIIFYIYNFIAGADINGKMKFSCTDSEVEPGSLDQSVTTMLLRSIENNDHEVLKMLLKSGADPNYWDKDAHLPLIAAIVKAGDIVHSGNSADYDRSEDEVVMCIKDEVIPVVEILLENGAFG